MHIVMHGKAEGVLGSDVAEKAINDALEYRGVLIRSLQNQQGCLKCAEVHPPCNTCVSLRKSLQLLSREALTSCAWSICSRASQSMQVAESWLHGLIALRAD